jgi:hypothetical protein
MHYHHHGPSARRASATPIDSPSSEISMPVEQMLAAGVTVLLLLALPFYLRWHLKRQQAMLAAWAAAQHLKILHVHRRLFPPLGQWLTSSNQQSFMDITVLDLSTQRIRQARVRLGGYWMGVLDTDAIDVTWQPD